jgi:hypothetical protein
MKFGFHNRYVTKPSESGWALMFMGLRVPAFAARRADKIIRRNEG